MGRFALLTATFFSLLAVLLVLGAVHNDLEIDGDKGVATAEVLSAGRLRSAVSFVTPDGNIRNPKLGVLYPTNLIVGQRIDVEYARSDPELVRVAGRDARVALLPAGSVIAVAWALALPAWWWCRRAQRRRPDVASPSGRVPAQLDQHHLAG
nr:DUF3592 domain-containing protein [Skermania piniformis]